MVSGSECPPYDVPLTAYELCLIEQALRETLNQLGTQRMILLDNGKMVSYESKVEEAVDYEMLLAKIRRKELEEND